MTTPQRGEVWLVDLGMAAKVRPALVVSVGASDSDRALATLVPHTTSVRGTAFEAAVSVDFLKPGAFDAQNLITIPHAKSGRLASSIGGSWAWSNRQFVVGWGSAAPRPRRLQPTARR